MAKQPSPSGIRLCLMAAVLQSMCLGNWLTNPIYMAHINTH